MGTALEVRGISKRFASLLANDSIDFSLEEGEIHALLGENGAGKTTLMRILYGLLQPDEGSIEVRGGPIRLRSPHDALRHGIGMVHQHFMLVPTMTVTENIVLGQELSSGPFLRSREASRRVRQVSEDFGIPLRPEALVGQLSVGEQQRVEIVKALYRGVDILILDEPTAAITPSEAEALFGCLRSMRRLGKSIIFISHKLKEVLSISDRVTVLRSGAVVGTLPRSEATEASLASLMVGREDQAGQAREPSPAGDVVLSARGLRARGNRGNDAVKDLSLSLRSGEILGIAGVDGNGQSELAEALAGLRSLSSGHIDFCGMAIAGLGPRRRMELGLRYVPADRRLRGAAVGLPVSHNAALRDYRSRPFSRFGLLDSRAIETFAARIADEYGFRRGSLREAAGSLSGGNLQKLILGRETASVPRLLVVEHPTRGLDIGATRHVHGVLRAKAALGAAILLFSADLDELLALSDRVAVMYEGGILYESPTAGLDLPRLGLAMAGLSRGEGAA